jgi:hypothetical protein
MRERSSDPFRFFDLIYCINLDSRPDRWQEVVREFSAVGIADRVERFPAITHAEPREGCRLSHVECVRRADAAGAETVLIFEDDVIFRGLTQERLARLLSRLRTIPDWELLYFGGTVLADPERHGELMKVPMAGTHAYAIHRRAFAKIPECTLPYDIWLARNLQSYCADPIVAWQRAGFSDVDGKWSAPLRFQLDYYLKFVGTPKAKTVVSDILRRRLRWRRFRIRAKLRFGRFIRGERSPR